MEFSRGTEIAEMKNPERNNYREIKSEGEMTGKEARGFWDKVFESMGIGENTDTPKKYYSTYEERINRAPVEKPERGHYEGERGESKFIPSDETENGRKAIEKLTEKGLDGIEYRNAEPDFSKCAEATVRIKHMTENRYDYGDEDGIRQKGNYTQANIKCAEMWNEIEKDGRSDWSGRDVEKYRVSNGLSWHECCDTKTMQLLPREIHEYFRHSGGVRECQIRDKSIMGGEFDE